MTLKDFYKIKLIISGRVYLLHNAVEKEMTEYIFVNNCNREVAKIETTRDGDLIIGVK